MSHISIYNSETQVVESKFQGDLTLKEIKEMADEFLLFAKEKDCFLFLNDYREVTVKLSTFEIYEIPKILADVFARSGFNARQLKRALIVSKDIQDYLFFENVTANSGQNAKVFYDVDEAKKWLFGE